MFDARGARRGGGRSCKPAASSSTLELSTKRNGSAWVVIRDQAALQMLPAGFDSSTTCNASPGRAPPTVANGVRTPGTSRKRVEFDSSALLLWRARLLARSPLFQSGQTGSKPVRATITCSSSRQGRRALIAETRVQVPHRWPRQCPRRMDRGQRYERRLRRFESSRGYPRRRARGSPAPS